MNRIWNYTTFLLLVMLVNITSYLMDISILWKGTLLYLVFIGSIILHEIGHFIGGSIFKFKLRHLVAGPLFIIRKDGKVKARINQSFGFLSSGVCGMFSEDNSPSSMRGYIVYYIGGISVHLILFVVSIIVIRFSLSANMTFFVRWLGMINFIMLIISSITYAHGTDGRVVRDLLKKEPACENFIWVQNIYLNDTLAKDISVDEYNKIVELSTNTTDPAIFYLSNTLLALRSIEEGFLYKGEEYFKTTYNMLNEMMSESKQETAMRIQYRDYFNTLKYYLDMIHYDTHIKNRLAFGAEPNLGLLNEAKRITELTIDNRGREFSNLIINSVNNTLNSNLN